MALVIDHTSPPRGMRDGGGGEVGIWCQILTSYNSETVSRRHINMILKTHGLSTTRPT